MKKVKITFLLMVLITITVFTLAVNAESTSDPSDSAYNTLKDNLSGVDPYLGDDLTPDKIMDSTLSGQGISSGSILSSVTQAILKELSGEIGVLVSITAIAYIISYISAIGDGSLGKNNEAAFMAAFAVLATQIVISFSTTAQWGFGAINDMELVMHSSIPLLAALSVNITAPSFLLTVQVAALVIQTVFMPLAILHGGLGIVNGVTARFSLAGMQTMVKNLFTWGLGITMTILTGVTVITGVTGKAFTGLGSKTLRFAAGSMVPVVGRYMAEAADAVFNSASIIKDTAGAGVMAGILLICAAPFIKILAMVIVYRLIAVLVQPVSDERIGNAITAAADSMTMIMGLMALIGMLFVLNTAVFVSLGSSI